MKNITKLLFVITTLALVFVGCDNDDYTGHSKINFNAPTATYSSTAGNNITVLESSVDPDDGETFTIEATLSEAVQFDTYIDLTQTGGTVDGGDYEVTRIFVPSLHTTGTGTVTFFKTGNVEGDETLELTANTNSANVNGSDVFNFTIEDDYVNDVISFTFDWSGSYSYTPFGSVEVTADYCDIDMDFLIFDGGFNIVPVFDAATGSCPEHFDLSSLGDGIYYLVADMWENPIAGLNMNQDLPITISYDQEYFGSGEFVYNGYNTNDTSGMYIIATLEVSGGYNYVVAP